MRVVESLGNRWLVERVVGGVVGVVVVGVVGIVVVGVVVVGVVGVVVVGVVVVGVVVAGVVVDSWRGRGGGNFSEDCSCRAACCCSRA